MYQYNITFKTESPILSIFFLPQKLLDIRNAKKQRKADLAKRRTYASQQRMKKITQLVSGKSFIHCICSNEYEQVLYDTKLIYM